MEIRTLCDIFYQSISYQKAEHLKFKKNGYWQSISSQEFCMAVEELSFGLQQLGIAPGDHVAILSENRPEWAFVDLAILLSQGVSAPIYPNLTPSQILYILNDSESKILFVSNAAQAKKVTEIRDQAVHLKHVIYMDEDSRAGLCLHDLRAEGRNALGKDPDAVRKKASRVKPDEIASLIYTSGTTGDPKGVMLTHRNFVSNVMGCHKVFEGLGPADIALSFLPLCHVFERVSGHYLMLEAGATIVYAESIDKVPENMIEIRPTVMCAVPRLYEKMYARIHEKVAGDPPLRQRIFRWALQVGRQRFKHRLKKTRPGIFQRIQCALADKLVFDKIKARTGGRLRLFVSGGAPLVQEIGEFFGAVGLTIIEGYGLTETSPVVSANRPSDLKPGSVGRPLDGVEVKIAPDGEILTRGPHVMKGYFKKPEATAEVIDREGWFHTGDIGVLDADGFLTITDRKKDLIITSGGKNIAPQPIENLIKTSPFVSEVVMIGNRRNFPSALVVPQFENLEKWAKALSLVFADRADLIRKPQVVELYDQTIRDLTRHLAQFERIKKITLLSKEFSLEAGELTPTLKVKRRFVEKKYEDLIGKMYETMAGAA